MRSPRIWTIAALGTGALLAWAGVLASGLAACSGPSASPTEPADLILVGGVIHTMDGSDTVAEAIAVTDGVVTYVGDRAGAEALRVEHTRVVQLDGEAVLPGFIDAHSMPFRLGRHLESLDLAGATSVEEARRRVAEACAQTEPGAWIDGQGWDQTRWDPPVFPTADDLAACDENPVVLMRIGAHTYWLNDVAMQRAGINRGTPDVEGGRILRDASGDPTGVVTDNAMRLVDAVRPSPTQAERKACLLRAQEHFLRMGVTAVVAGGVDQTDLHLLEELAREGELVQRFSVMLLDEGGLVAENLARGPRDGMYHDHLTVRCIKLYADGALGSRGAALLQEYADAPGQRGVLTSSTDRIEQVTARALKAGFQVGTHAIGDRALRMVLDAYEGALREHPTRDHRLLVEHAQIVHEEDAVRMRELGVLPVITPTAATSDMGWAPGRLGPGRLVAAYPWRTIVDQVERVPMSLDAPVETSNPLWAIYAAVTRQDRQGRPAGGWLPGQRLTVLQAVRGFTIDAAYGTFAEERRGSLEPGKLADLVVLSADPFDVAPERLLTTEVLMTVIGGVVVHDGRPTAGDPVAPDPPDGAAGADPGT